ncbi:DUF4365 domain-containing protein [Bordetella genomosp. 13]|uniref:DUF4365 domain-containing protein n=1 Tax=Bordetella genomosp. 13 TaxID=463040 RepID=UPI0011A2F3F2|nr:DUF4365 domain-containing protein [Bordetella genomosp. 13]
MNHPKESEAQKIGHMAALTLSAVHPPSWRTKSLEGTDDVGLDYQVQVVDDSQYKAIFRLQLKGTTTPNLSAEGDKFSISIKTSTLNYYADCTEPILFVLCDLSANTDPRKCPAYYTWIHDELARLFDRPQSEQQQTITIHVPKHNELTELLDVLPVLREQQQIHELGKSLNSTVKKNIPGADAESRGLLLQKIGSGFESRGAAFLQAVADTDSYWPEAAANTVPGRLTAARNALNQGRATEALMQLSLVESDLSKSTANEQGAYWYLLGKSRQLTGNDSEALKAYTQACNIVPTASKNHLARIECDMAIRLQNSPTSRFDDLADQANTLSGPDAIGLTARLFALSGRIDDARGMLSTDASSNSSVDRCIVEFINGDVHSTHASCEHELASHQLDDIARLHITLMSAQCKLYLALGLNRITVECIRLSPSGPATLDTDLLSNAWQTFEAARGILANLGWPRQIGWACEAWMMAALLTGKTSHILSDFQSAAEKHPDIIHLQFCLEKIAANCGKYDIALAANSKQPLTDDAKARRALLFYEDNKAHECLELTLEYAASGDHTHALFPAMLCICIIHAEEMLRSQDAQTLEAVLNGRADWEKYQILLNFSRKEKIGDDEGTDRLETLIDYYEKNNKPILIGSHILISLDPNKRTEAKTYIRIAKEIENEERLTPELQSRLACCYATLARWGEMRDTAERALSQYPEHSKLRTILAFSLDKLGLASEAIGLLEEILSKDTTDELALATYLRLSIRFGDNEKATKIVESLISREKDDRKKFSLVLQLFDLVFSTEPNNPRLPAIARRLGKLAQQGNERDEAIFILSSFSASSANEQEPDPEYTAELQSRIKSFSERFPDSKYFRVGTVSEGTVLEDITNLLEKVNPGFEARFNRTRSLERELERGELPLPYCWRPRVALTTVNDPLELWAMSKLSRRDQRQFHLPMVLTEWHAATPPTETPLLDIPALLVIHDLKLFEALFSIFPHIAISQRTLAVIRETATTPFLSRAIDIARSLLLTLRTYSAKIYQPEPELDEGQTANEGPPAHGTDIRILANTLNYTLYSDDAWFSVWVTDNQPNKQRICTLDLLHWSKERGIISEREHAERVSLLCRWHVSLHIPIQAIIASLPPILSPRMTVAEAASLIQEDIIAEPILEGIWNVRLPYEQLHQNIVMLLKSLSSNPELFSTIAPALTLVWYWKASLRTDIQVPAKSRLATVFAHLLHHAADDDEDLPPVIRSAYFSTVEAYYGAGMQESDEESAMEALALAAVMFRKALEPSNRAALDQKLRRAWTIGTSFNDRFWRHFEEHTIALDRDSA